MYCKRAPSTGQEDGAEAGSTMVGGCPRPVDVEACMEALSMGVAALAVFASAVQATGVYVVRLGVVAGGATGVLPDTVVTLVDRMPQVVGLELVDTAAVVAVVVLWDLSEIQ